LHSLSGSSGQRHHGLTNEKVLEEPEATAERLDNPGCWIYGLYDCVDTLRYVDGKQVIQQGYPHYVRGRDKKPVTNCFIYTEHGLLGEISEELEDGTLRFLVINGAWWGTFHNDTVTVERYGTSFPDKIVWRGSRIVGYDYNDAIESIQKRLANDNPVS
jgi:hypothetical protein